MFLVVLQKVGCEAEMWDWPVYVSGNRVFMIDPRSSAFEGLSRSLNHLC